MDAPTPTGSPTGYRKRIEATLRALGADPALHARRRLPVYAEARRLQPIGVGADGRDKFLTPGAAVAWARMREAARNDGVELLLYSAFRGFDYQLALIRGKIARGRSLDEVLAVNAPPGCSEHHSGRALDLGCTGVAPLEETFESTQAFAWLTRRGGEFGFRMSFPRDNRWGYTYEPWHWYFAGIRPRRTG